MTTRKEVFDDVRGAVDRREEQLVMELSLTKNFTIFSFLLSFSYCNVCGFLGSLLPRSCSSTLPPRASLSHNISFVNEQYNFLSFILQFSLLPIPASHHYTNYVVKLIFNHRKPNISFFCSSVGRVYET
jgi:hypothetical protein